MTRARSRRLVTAAVLVPALLAALALLPTRSPAAQRPSREEELATLRREIARLETRLARVRERRQDLAGQLATLETELELQEKQVAEARAAGELASTRVRATESEVARLGGELARARDDLSTRVDGLYRLGGQGGLRLFFSLDRRGDLLAGIRLLRYLARRDATAVERYTSARDRLDEERRHLLAQRAEVERWVGEEEARRDRLATARGRQAALLARVDSERRQLTARRGELGDRAAKLSAFLDLVTGRSGAAPEGTPIQRFRGVLDWPVEGRVRAAFGPQLDPRYRTRVPHHGVTLTTRTGDEVRAIYAGQVLFAAPFQGYGPTVVVHHPGRVFSLYAGLARVAVAVRQAVALGQPLGTAADTLYLEIRVENRPEDPADWLR